MGRLGRSDRSGRLARFSAGEGRTLQAQIIAQYTAAGWTTHAVFLARAEDVALVVDKVSVWVNHGTGSDATQATDAARPTFNATGLNGLPSLDVASDHVDTGDIDLTADSALAMTVLFQDTDTGVRYQAEMGKVLAANQGALIRTNNPLDTLEAVCFDVGQPSAKTTATINMTSPNVVTNTWDSVLTSLVVSIRHAGADATDSRVDVDRNFFQSAFPLVIGARHDGATGMVGSIAAVVLATGTTAIPVAAVVAVEALLQAEWGI